MYRIAVFLTCVCLGGTFIYASLQKWINPVEADSNTLFVAIVGKGLISDIVVGLEAVLGLWLITNWRWRLSVSVTSIILLFFAGLLVSEVRREKPRDCGCAGSTSGSTHPDDVRFNLLSRAGQNVLFASAGMFVFMADGRRKQSRSGGGT